MIGFRKSTHDGRQVAYADAAQVTNTIDAYKAGISNRQMTTFAFQVTEGKSTNLDCNFWLPMAAEEYDLSRKIQDYVIVPNVPIIISDIPNTNGIAFTKRELMRFRPKAGRMAYKTFKGKPCFVEHRNTDHTQACGVILDCYLDEVKQGSGLVKIVELLAFDRYKNPEVAESILSGASNCYSMGTFFEGFTMSDGSKPTPRSLKEPLYANPRGELVFCLPHGLDGFETSVVANPAFAHATNTAAFVIR